MKLLYEYTLDYIKRNRRGSIAIMVAVLMVSTMLSALCSTLYTMYTDNLRLILENTGDWHGELYDITSGSSLDIIEGFDSVENIMIKGQWRVAEIDDPRREYLVYRDANADYWQYMNEQLLITEGRMPASSGEIVLSKQYFEHHTDLSIGDTLTLPVGERISGDTVISPVAATQAGESFRMTGQTALTVVGKLDLATPSDVPAYTALGYLEHESILPNDDLTVYFRFKNIRDTYTELPKIAEAVGYTRNEYGEYSLRYNVDYLMRRLVFSNAQMELMGNMDVIGMPLMFTVTGLLVVGVFVVIIHNAFALSANARLTQLGVLASIGATPKQIRGSVLFEAFTLTAIPLPLGLLLGRFAVEQMIRFINLGNTQITGERGTILFTFGLAAALPSVLLTLLTVWWSALIPARRVSKLSPIAAIRQGDSGGLKKPRKHSLWRLMGLEGELAANAVHARRRSYRTATLSLLLSFLTLTCVLIILSASDTSTAVYGNDKEWADKDIEAGIRVGDELHLLDSINAIDGVADTQWYGRQTVAIWLPPDALSTEFAATGGYEAAAKLVGNTPLYRDGQYRTSSALIGLADDVFAEYCAALGIDPAPYYQTDSSRVILYNTIEDIHTTSKRNPIYIPYLNKTAGDLLTCNERVRDETEGNYSFAVEVAATSDRLPFAEALAGRYGVKLFMPLSRMREIAKSFDQPSTGAYYVNGRIRTTSHELIVPVRELIDALCESSLGSGDYNTLDKAEREQLRQLGRRYTTLMFGFVSGLLAVIGLSNVWATISGTLHSRRRELSMLRSVGMQPSGIYKMLFSEALLLGLTPILLAVPVQAGVLWVLLFINEVTIAEWLPFAPVLPTLGFVAAVLVVMAAAYLLGGRHIMRSNIVESIKADTM